MTDLSQLYSQPPGHEDQSWYIEAVFTGMQLPLLADASSLHTQGTGEYGTENPRAHRPQIITTWPLIEKVCHGLDSDMSQSHSDDVEFVLCICIPFPPYI